MFGMDEPTYCAFDPNQDLDPNDPDARRAADHIRELIALHPEGITFSEFVQAHRGQITVDPAVILAIRLMLREGSVYSSKEGDGSGGWDGSGGFLDHVKLFAHA